jgi:hypothetical protein
MGAAAAVGAAAPAAAAGTGGPPAAAADEGAITRFYAQYKDVYTCRSEGPRAQGLRGANSWYCTSTARLYLTWNT